MPKRLRKLFSRESGQSLVELALALPIILFLFLGIMDASWVVMAQLEVTNAAQNAAKEYVALGNSTDHYTPVETNLILKDYIIQNIKVVLPEDIHVMSYERTDDSISVHVTAQVKSLTGIIAKKHTVEREVTLKTK